MKHLQFHTFGFTHRCQDFKTCCQYSSHNVNFGVRCMNGSTNQCLYTNLWLIMARPCPDLGLILRIYTVSQSHELTPESRDFVDANLISYVHYPVAKSMNHYQVISAVRGTWPATSNPAATDPLTSQYWLVASGYWHWSLCTLCTSSWCHCPSTCMKQPGPNTMETQHERI